MQPGLSDDLDAPGFRLFWDYHSGALGGDFGIYAGSFDWGLGWRARDFVAGAADRAFGHLVLRRGGVDHWFGSVRRACRGYLRKANNACWRAGQTDSIQYLFFSALVPGDFHFAVVCIHGRDFPLHDGVRAGTGTAQRRQLQLPLPRQRSRSHDGGRFWLPSCWWRCWGSITRLSSPPPGNFAIAALERGDRLEAARDLDRARASRAATGRRRAKPARRRLQPAHPVDFILDRLQRHGHGGGLDARFYSGAENAGVFVCAHRLRLSGRDVVRLDGVPPRFEEGSAAFDGGFDFAAGGGGLSADRGGGPKIHPGAMEHLDGNLS